MQKKSVRFIWNKKCQDSFEKLKQLLTTTPVLKNFDPSNDFVVCTHASKEELGGVLTQEGHVICYESWKLKEHDKNYVIHDMELEAIIHALKIWLHYLIGNKLFLLIENIGLKYFFDKKH